MKQHFTLIVPALLLLVLAAAITLAGCSGGGGGGSSASYSSGSPDPSPTVSPSPPPAGGKILLSGMFQSYNETKANYITRVNSDGSLDNTFTPGTGANASIDSMARQADGRYMIMGYFTSYNGTVRNKMARIGADGALDTTFNPGAGALDIYCMALQAVQAEERILIGGGFQSYDGTSRERIARINSNGSLDATFNPGLGPSTTNNPVAETNNSRVYSLAPQPDGKILIGGTFKFYDGTARGRIARINADGSLDATFNPGVGAAIPGADSTTTVYSIVLPGGGKILAGGNFTSFDGAVRNRIVRLNADGSLDTTFAPGTGADGDITRMALQSDGRILISGSFTTYNGTSRNRIARIHADGSLDPTFNPGAGPDSGISSLVMQSDGRILIGGHFTHYDGTSRERIARLNTDGTLDTSFLSAYPNGANNGVLSIIVQ